MQSHWRSDPRALINITDLNYASPPLVFEMICSETANLITTRLRLLGVKAELRNTLCMGSDNVPLPE